MEGTQAGHILTDTMKIDNFKYQFILRAGDRQGMIVKRDRVGVLTVLEHGQNIVFHLLVLGPVLAPTADEHERFVFCCGV